MKVTISSPELLEAKFTGRRHQLGLWGVNYYGGYYPFLNWWKGTGSLEVVSSTNGALQAARAFAGGYLDANGDLAKPVLRDVQRYQAIITDFQGGRIGEKWAGEEIIMTWDGRGANAAFFNCPGTATYNSARGRASFLIGMNPGTLSAGFIMQAHGYNDPPRNIKIFQKRYENETTIEGITYPGINQGGLFNPHWLHEMRKFGRLRTMDWGFTNNSEIVDYADIADEAYFRWGKPKGTAGNTYTKSGMPLSVICALATQSGADIHICIPHKATDACVQSMATYFAANFPAGQKLIIEYSNEVWNQHFHQKTWVEQPAQAGVKFTADYAGGRIFTGYRAAQIMKIFSDTFDNRSRWRGCLATQTGWTYPTKKMLDGVDFYLKEWNTVHPGSTMRINDLFDELSVTGYFGDFEPAVQISTIAQATMPLVTTTSAHGFVAGDRVTFGIRSADGMTQLDGVTATVIDAPTNKTMHVNVDTTNFTAMAPNGFSFVFRGGWFDLMDQSQALFDAKQKATKYDYFSEQLAEAMITGSCSSGKITISYNLLNGPNAIKAFWMAQKAIADAHGLELTQYEGGNAESALTLLRDSVTVGVRWNTWIDAASYSAPIAKAHSEMARQFFKISGKYPSKFVEGGSYGKYGRWAGVRWWVSNGDADGDLDNPVWEATVAANAVNFKP